MIPHSSASPSLVVAVAVNCVARLATLDELLRHPFRTRLPLLLDAVCLVRDYSCLGIWFQLQLGSGSLVASAPPAPP